LIIIVFATSVSVENWKCVAIIAALFFPDDLVRAAATLDAEARIVSSPPGRAVFGALRIYERATGERLRRRGRGSERIRTIGTRGK